VPSKVWSQLENVVAGLPIRPHRKIPQLEMHWPNRSSSRVLTFVVCIFLPWLVSRIFQLRQSSWSCRTVSSCLGFGSHEMHIFSKPGISDVTAYENVLHNGTLHYRRATENTDPSIQFLALNENEPSWSSDFRETRRTAHDFMDVLPSTKLNLAHAFWAKDPCCIREPTFCQSGHLSSRR